MTATRPTKERLTRLPRTVLLLGLTSFLTDAGSEMIFPLLPVFVADTLGGGPAFLGIIEGAADAVSSVLKLLAGHVADRLPRRKPLVLSGYALASLVRPLMALATAPWHALVIRLADRTGKGIRSSPRDALIADSVPSESSGRAFGFHRAMDHAGAIVGPLVATGLLAASVSMRDVFLWAAVPGFLAVVAVTMIREEPRMPAIASETTPTKANAPLPADLRSYLAILLVFSLANSSDAFLLLRAREMGVSLAAIPILWAALHVSKMAWSYAGGIASDVFPRVRLILAGWIVYFLTYLGLAFASHAWHAWLLFVVYGAYYGLSEPAEKALVKDLAPMEMRGRAFGYYNFIFGATSLPAGLLMGGIWAWRGPRWALGLGALVALLAILVLSAWEANRGRRPQRR